MQFYTDFPARCALFFEDIKEDAFGREKHRFSE